MNFEVQLHNTVRKDDFSRAYLKKGENGREKMYFDLLESIKQNDCADDASAEASTSTSTKSSTNEQEADDDNDDDSLNVPETDRKRKQQQA